jgi:dTDP-4-dehydrorhamnose reductase
MQKVLVLGASGMLGSACLQVLSQETNLEVIGTSRNKDPKFIEFDVSKEDVSDLLNKTKPSWIINCIGSIKTHIDENVPSTVENAVKVNSEFPKLLARAAEGVSAKVIQIATDCVYSGTRGSYVEADLHDATDVYGKTKSLGEVPSSSIMHLRASIIGPEVGRSTSLLEWFLSQPDGAKLNGFTNHFWNGVTTHVFAKICLGVIRSGEFQSGVHHLIPKDTVAKADLLKMFARAYNRGDILISDYVTPNIIDRTLGTSDKEFNNNLWVEAGYVEPPTIEEMVFEQADLIRS